MSALQASRRVFLSNLAILSAGVALGSNAGGVFSDNYSSPNLEALWKQFCRQQSGSSYSGIFKGKNAVIACLGHQHREGALVYLPNANVIAQPIWIYWAGNALKPADMLVNLYNGDVAIGCINQFELKTLADSKGDSDRLAAFLKVDDRGNRLFAAQTKIGYQNNVSTHFGAVRQTAAFV